MGDRSVLRFLDSATELSCAVELPAKQNMYIQRRGLGSCQIHAVLVWWAMVQATAKIILHGLSYRDVCAQSHLISLANCNNHRSTRRYTISPWKLAGCEWNTEVLPLSVDCPFPFSYCCVCFDPLQNSSSHMALNP